MISKEKISELLLSPSSKSIAEMLGQEAMCSEETFRYLVEMIQKREQPFAWKAAWAIDKGSEKHPEKLDAILPEIYDLLLLEDYDGSVRLLMKLLLRRPLIEDKAALLIDKAIGWVNNEGASVSKRMYGIELMYRIYLIYPDFKNELQSIIKHNIEKGGKAGFMNKLKKMQKQLA